MNNNEEFEDFFRNEFEKNPVEYKEEYWQQAEQLILANEKRERRRFIFYLSSFTALLCLLIGVYCIKNNSSITLLKNNISVNRNISEDISERKEMNANTQNKSFSENKNNQLHERLKVSSNNKKIISTETENNSPTKNHKILVLTANKKHKKNVLNIYADNKSNSTDSKKRSRIAKNNDGKNNQYMVIRNAPKSDTYTDEINSLSSEFSEDLIAMECIQINNFEKLNTAQIKKPSSMQYSLIAGAGLYKGFGNASGFTIHPILGVGVSYNLSSKFDADINLLYIERSNVNTTKKFSSEYYDFGYNKETTQITTRKIKYISLPLFIKYHFQIGQSIIAGISLSHILTSKDDLTKITSSDNGNPVTSNSTESGFVNGFKKYDLAIVAGYEIVLVKNLNAGIRLNYGLIDVTNNSYYQNNSKDYNISVALSFRYVIFNK